MDTTKAIIFLDCKKDFKKIKLTKPSKIKVLNLIANHVCVYQHKWNHEYDDIIPVYCREHKCYELVPYFNYKYDFYVWYKKGIHPRFSLLKIVLSFNELQKYTKALKMLQRLMKFLKPEITEIDIQRIIKELLEKEKKQLQYIIENADLSTALQYLNTNQKIMNAIWRKLTEDNKQKVIDSQKINIKDDNIAILGDEENGFYATKKEIRRLKFSAKTALTFHQMGATIEEIIELSRLPFWTKDYDFLLRYVRNQITPEDFFKINNHEIRRYILRKVDIQKIIKKLKLIAKDEEGELYCDQNNTKYLCVSDPSTKEIYLLSVPNSVKTPKEAKKWTFRFYIYDDVKWIKET